MHEDLGGSRITKSVDGRRGLSARLTRLVFHGGPRRSEEDGRRKGSHPRHAAPAIVRAAESGPDSRFMTSQPVEQVGGAPRPSEKRQDGEDIVAISVDRCGDDVRRFPGLSQPGECRPSCSMVCSGEGGSVSSLLKISAERRARVRSVRARRTSEACQWKDMVTMSDEAHALRSRANAGPVLQQAVRAC